MTSPRRTAARLLACAATLACALSLALPAGAAAQEEEEPRQFCTAGRPHPACEMVLVAQFSYYPGILPSSDLANPYEWEIGVLVNRGPRHAVGGTLVLGIDANGRRAAVKARYRRWISRNVAVDGSGGLAFANQGWVSNATDRRMMGFTGDVAAGLTDWVSVGVRGDVMWSRADGKPRGATYGTVRWGTGPGIVLSVVGAVLLVFIVSVSG